MELQSYLEERREIIERELKRLMPAEHGPFARHIKAMRYSLLSGGKRLRPILCLAAADAVSGGQGGLKPALPTACALECIHTYSLIHDDLPAMDNDELRRGLPTNHLVFGEAAAILAGDGLLTFAFDLLSGEASKDLPAETRLHIIQRIARAAGPLGMVGGQSLDMLFTGGEADYDTLHTLHKAKTGRLITAAVETGALAAGANERQIAALHDYGKQAGLAFQIADDLLDLKATVEELGKNVGKDVKMHKLTFPAFFGLETARVMAQDAVHAALKALADFDASAEPLRALARYIIERGK